MSGTDSSLSGGWATPGPGPHHELDVLMQAGLTPMQAIMASSRNVAEGFRILDRLGTVEPGKLVEPLQRHEWGGTSNRSHLLVNFTY